MHSSKLEETWIQKEKHRVTAHITVNIEHLFPEAYIDIY